ncbi:dihydrofolate reductase family protein [Nocardia sp. CS682]|uniref:dihydrofolate reductase family protein n=1 Tax=Nocardia sp. CS682 TaxID=1047172 RepID=UPI001074DD52|nr:dihydrofolate reductase family protein [Nocardia sp. CS682]QBS40428.1 dihydrofolate reductase [Nocardia sp. CS682]
MRDLIVTENITLDGVIEAADWFAVANADGVDQSDLTAVLGTHMASSDAVLFGRVSFEQMRGYWPKQTDDPTGVTDHLNKATKYVVSSTLEGPEWENTVILRGVDELSAVRAQPGKDIVATGSIQLVHALIAADLVDEYRLFVYPVVQGTGRRLFADAARIPALRLIETQPFKSGVVLLRYRRR